MSSFDIDSYPLPVPDENYYDAEAAKKAISFIENLRHVKGKWAGQKIKLMDWQKNRIIRPLFGLMRPNGTRQYRTAYIEIPRKNAKSTMAAAIALYLLFADGEPGAEVYGAAYDRDQASVVFDIALQMVEECKPLDDRSDPTPYQKIIKNPATNGFYRAISKETKNSHGYNAHGIIFDELHTQKTREMWDVLDTSRGSREEPLMVAITTAGDRRESVCKEQHDYVQDLLDGVFRDYSYFGAIWSAEDYLKRDEENSWRDEEGWYEANPALYDEETGEGFRSIEEMREAAKKAERQKSFRMTFKRLYLNIWTSAYEQFIEPEEWGLLADGFHEADLEGLKCWAGLDLASKYDLASVVYLFEMPDGELRALPRIFCPEETIVERASEDGIPYRVWAEEGDLIATPGNVIDHSAIEQTIKDDAEKFNIQSIGYDRWEAESLVQELVKENIQVVPIGQGYASMNAPTKQLDVLVRGEKLRHNDNECLSWTASNLIVQQDPAGNLKPDRGKSQDKIDPMVALIMAIDRWMRTEEPEKPESRYKSEGIRTI